MKKIVSALLCVSFLLSFPTCVYAESKAVTEKADEIIANPEFIEVSVESIELESFLKNKTKAYRVYIQNKGKNDIQLQEIKNIGLSSDNLELYSRDSDIGWGLLYGLQ